MFVVITGASSGLGEFLAVELGRRGHALGLIARREGELERVATLVRATGAKAAIATADVTDGPALKVAIDRLAAELGPIDILVANAGGDAFTPATRLDASKVSRVFRLNVDGVVNAFEAVLPSMLARKSGQIVAVSSMAGRLGISPSSAYSASKAAVTILMDGFSVELQPYGIAVTTVHPGFVRTPLTAKNKHPMPFLVEPDRAARLMADGILARRRRVDFPFMMNLITRLAAWLPAFVYEPLLRRLSPSPRPV